MMQGKRLQRDFDFLMQALLICLTCIVWRAPKHNQMILKRFQWKWQYCYQSKWSLPFAFVLHELHQISGRHAINIRSDRIQYVVCEVNSENSVEYCYCGIAVRFIHRFNFCREDGSKYCKSTNSNFAGNRVYINRLDKRWMLSKRNRFNSKLLFFVRMLWIYLCGWYTHE